MNGKALAVLLAAGGLGVGIYLLVKKKVAPAKALWEVGDVLSCYAAGDPGYFTVMDRREVDGSWHYHIGEGPPPIIDDLGWWTESQLLNSPWVCKLP